MEDLYWWLALERAPFVGPITIAKLIAAFGHPKSVLTAGFDEIRTKSAISARIADAITLYRPDGNEIQRDMDKLAEMGARLITRWDSDYPGNLLDIYDPPALLFVRGCLKPGDELAIAVVGSRMSSNYGVKVTNIITRDLVRAGFTIVSGLARGIDTVCHSSALNEGGRTIGVLGCGLDIHYPAENRELMDRMAEQGAVISEFRPGIRPYRTNFFRRNRIVSGLSKAVLVVEASRRSGSLITVNHAIDQGRDVFAVPGNVLHECSRGPHHLIKQGAGLVESAQDILSGIFPSNEVRDRIPEESVTLSLYSGDISELARQVLECVDMDPVPVDIICQISGLTAGNVLAALMELELLGIIKQSPGKVFSKIL